MRIGIDLGGTKIEAAALDDSGEIVERCRAETPRGDYRATIRAATDLTETLERRTGTRGTVGVGIPGSVSPETGLVRNANSTWLIGRPLGHDLGAALNRPVRLANDADCFALSEAVDGAGAGARTVFGVIVGTGTGGGIVVEGRLLGGPNAIAGEWGHNPLPWPAADELPGPVCYCGKTGCIETFLSGPGLARDHLAATGETFTAAQIAERAQRAEPAALATMERYVRRMAKSLATVINVIDPDVIVLGGGLSNIAALYDRVPAVWAEYVFSDCVRTALRPARHGDSSGVRGAAWLWPPGSDKSGDQR